MLIRYSTLTVSFGSHMCEIVNVDRSTEEGKVVTKFIEIYTPINLIFARILAHLSRWNIECQPRVVLLSRNNDRDIYIL